MLELSLPGTLALAAMGALAAWRDGTERRLPNGLSLVCALLGLGFALASGGLAQAGSALLHALVSLLGGMVLYRFGWIGAGDAKFYAACAAWFPLSRGLTLLTSVSMAGLVLVLVWFALGQVRRGLGRGRGGSFALLPYGIAIALGAVVARLVSAG